MFVCMVFMVVFLVVRLLVFFLIFWCEIELLVSSVC